MRTEFQILAILIGAALVSIIGIQQQVYAPRNCGGCVEFKKMTHEFEKSVIDAAVGNPNEGPEPHLIPGLLQTYSDSVKRTFLGGPDTIPDLLEQYQQAVLRVFQAPPEPDKHQLHDQIKDFRQLTNVVATEVLTIAHEGFRDH